ncbi:hypothetical protein [Mesorhizobium sp. KR1-2]|uniref:hypothetical protein n=1 Tax=Mesorhizobium sp. KR1-2 TaxID=3156609 RepID=UPI0032B43B52
MKTDVHGTDAYADDKLAIRAVIARQFGSLNWSEGSPADWDAFAVDFFPSALLYPGARPAKSQTVSAFLERMKRLSETTLRRFREALLHCDICVFGNVAVAVAVCEQFEGGAQPTRNVEMMLLVRNEGAWQIVSQAWDTESPSKPIPAQLLSAAAQATQ